MKTMIKPEIGMGAFVSYHADTNAMTIVAVSENGKTVVAQRDTAVATGAPMSNQWIITPNPQGETMTFTLRANGQYVLQGDSMRNGLKLYVGERHEYYCYEF